MTHVKQDEIVVGKITDISEQIIDVADLTAKIKNSNFSGVTKPKEHMSPAHAMFANNFAPDLGYMLQGNTGLEAAGNKAWDDLNKTHGLMIQTLQLACMAGIVFRNPEILKCCPDVRTVGGLLKLQKQDIATLHKELGMIKAIHEGRTGDASPEDIMLTLGIYEQYSVWAARAEGTINENGRKITELAFAAEAKHRANAEAAALVESNIDDVLKEL